jgi:hypothetical protein
MASIFTVDGKQLRTANQVKTFLLDQLAQGHEVLPMADCDNFDWKTGCRGHNNTKGGGVGGKVDKSS